MKINKLQLKEKQKILAQEIIEICVDYYNVNLLKNTRKKEYVEARQMAIYLVRDFCDVLTYYQIRDIFNKHHANIIYSEKKISDLIDVDRKTRNDYSTLVEIIERRTNYKNMSYHARLKRNRKIQTFTSKLYSLDQNEIDDLDELVNNYLKSLEWKNRLIPEGTDKIKL